MPPTGDDVNGVPTYDRAAPPSRCNMNPPLQGCPSRVARVETEPPNTLEGTHPTHHLNPLRVPVKVKPAQSLALALDLMSKTCYFRGARERGEGEGEGRVMTRTENVVALRHAGLDRVG